MALRVVEEGATPGAADVEALTDELWIATRRLLVAWRKAEAEARQDAQPDDFDRAESEIAGLTSTSIMAIESMEAMLRFRRRR